MWTKSSTAAGFTLIELSLVLVIIGLIIGGVLVGRDLVAAAQVRAQISQIEKYNTAVNAFRSKYGYLPGDIPDPVATQYGFLARGTSPGQGDGDGIVEGIGNAGTINLLSLSGGETEMFWVDLAAANLVEGGFSNNGILWPSVVTLANLSQWLPPAKIGQGNYIYVWSEPAASGGTAQSNGFNYFGLSQITALSVAGLPTSTAGLSVQQAYNIDTKMDDGLPQTGRVMAYQDTGFPLKSCLAGGSPATCLPATVASATSPSATTCSDSGGVAGGIAQYSTTQNNGTGINCALSFQFQ